MATITLRLSSRVDARGKSEILMRFIASREHTFRLKTQIFIDPTKWDDEKGEVLLRRLRTQEQRELLDIKNNIELLRLFLIDEYEGADKNKVDKEWMQKAVDRFWHPESEDGVPFFPTYSDFIERSQVCEERKEQFRVVYRDLERMEKYRRRPIVFSEIDCDFLEEFEDFLTIEYQLVGNPKYRHIYRGMPKKSIPKERSLNTIATVMKKLRVFLKQCYKERILKEDPFVNYQIVSEMYGTPYFLTMEERDGIYKCNLSNHPHLEVQRDIFIFHCYCGARYGDLERFTKKDIVDGVLEYIPNKTRGNGNIGVVRVPLTSTAMDIVRKYAFINDDRLFPFISLDKYNASLRPIFLASRIKRYVSVMDSHTRTERKERLCDVATSHIARRTFIGNLYRQVKDQNLISSMSGHAEGSRAFARYRDIDIDIKKDVISLLETSKD